MATKLRSFFQNQQSVLVLKTLIFGGFLALVKIGDFGITPILFFLAIAGFLYARPIFNTFLLLNSFLILLALALLSIKLIDQPSFLMAVVAFFSFLFYLVIGIKNLVIIDRNKWIVWLILMIFYANSFLFFYFSRADYFWFRILILFFVNLLLFREMFKLAIPDFSKKRLVAIWLSDLLIIQLIWIFSLLPIGFFSAATLALLSAFALINLTIHYFKGELNQKLIKETIAVFVLLALLIFSSAQWTF